MGRGLSALKRQTGGWIAVFAVLMGLVPLAMAAPAEIPSAMRDQANQLSFLAALARRCDRALAVQGKAGLRTEACRDFERKAIPVLESLDKEAWLKAAEAADASRSRVTKLEWEFFWRQVQTDWNTVAKTMDHLRFMWK
jgi:putative SOS response-associated peptidase YedK